MHPANNGRLCPRGAALGDEIGLDGRLLHPQIAGRRASWDKAIKLVARRFAETIERHGPDSVGFIVSGQLLTEDHYVANKLMKGFIGSAHIGTGRGRSAQAAAHVAAFGEDVVPATYEDLDRADLIVMIGADCVLDHPVLHDRIMIARVDHGTRLVVIDSQTTVVSQDADLHLAIRPDTLDSLMKGLLAFCDRAGVTDAEYLARSVSAPEGFWESVRAGHDIWSVARRCGVQPGILKQFYQLFADTPRTITLLGGADDASSVLNVHLATGRIGKPGSAPFSIADAANAMGGREVGSISAALAAHMDYAPDAIARIARFWGAHRMATQAADADMLGAVEDGRIKALWIMGSDPTGSAVDGDRMRAALALCPFVVVSECFADTPTVHHAHVALPAAAWGEKDGTATNADRLISRQRALLPLPEDAKPDWWIITRVARAMGWSEAFPFDRAADIYREHARLSAYQNEGERLFNLRRHASMSNPAYDELTPWRWGEMPFDDGRFPTVDELARFSAHVKMT